MNDGKKQYEVNVYSREYYSNAAGDPTRGIDSIGLTGREEEFVFGWNPKRTAKFKQAKDETRNGKRCNVYTYDYKVDAPQQQYAFQDKVWVDTATKLPITYTVFVKEENKWRESSRTEFSEWQLDAPINASQFVWTPPAGISEHKVVQSKPVEYPPLLAAGTPAPDFTAAKWGGGDLKLSDYKGKVVILDFWATWCGPCQASMPHIEKIYQALKNKDIVVLGLCVWDTKEAYEKWVPANKNKYNFTFAFDPAADAAVNIAKSQFRASLIPTTYIIDKDGKIAAGIVGFMGKEDTRVEDALAKLGVQVPKSK